MKKWNFKNELARKTVHLFSLTFLVIYILVAKFSNKTLALMSLILLLGIFLTIEFFRLVHRRKIPLLHIFWRAKEKNQLAGNIYFLVGVIVVFAVFDFKIAVSALLMTTFGDMAAALFGMRFGKHWLKSIPNTAWEGIFAEFLVDFAIGMIILKSFPIAIIMALVATFVETVFTHADDNLTIPIFSGFAGQAVVIISKFL